MIVVLFILGSDLLVTFWAFYFCRQSGAYYDTLRWKAHITIRSGVLCHLLISRSIKGRNGRLISVAPQNEHKMTWLGVLSHLIVDSLAVRLFYVSFQYYFFQAERPFYVVQQTFAALVCAALASGLVSTFNQYKVR